MSTVPRRPQSAEQTARRRERFRVLNMRLDEVLRVFEGYAEDDDVPEDVKDALAALEGIKRDATGAPRARDTTAVLLPALHQLFKVTGEATSGEGPKASWMTANRRWHLQELDVARIAVEALR